MDKLKHMVRAVPYPGLPQELKAYHCYLTDAGHCISAIPRVLYPEAESTGNFDGYECPVPVKYVLEKGYEKRGDYLIIDVPYNQRLGLTVDDRYTEF